MSLRSRTFTAGALQGVVYDFSEAGDKVPLHRHDQQSHITVVAGGEVIVRVTGREDMRATAGRVIDWPLGTEHEWEAVSVPARIVNVFKPA